MTPYTDFLAYSGGSYQKVEDAFKYNGQHIVKVVGWSKTMDGSTEYIIENTWGADWGENGYARVVGGRGDSVDMYALGPMTNPYTAYDYYSMQ